MDLHYSTSSDAIVEDLYFSNSPLTALVRAVVFYDIASARHSTSDTTPFVKRRYSMPYEGNVCQVAEGYGGLRSKPASASSQETNFQFRFVFRVYVAWVWPTTIAKIAREVEP